MCISINSCNNYERNKSDELKQIVAFESDMHLHSQIITETVKSAKMGFNWRVVCGEDNNNAPCGFFWNGTGFGDEFILHPPPLHLRNEKIINAMQEILLQDVLVLIVNRNMYTFPSLSYLLKGGAYG